MVKSRRATLKKELDDRSVPEEVIKNTLATEITQPATAFKLAIARRRINRSSINPDLLPIFDKMQEVLGAYPENYSFDKGSRYYDVKAHPEKHINAFYRMAAFCEQEQIKSFQCFPLRTSFVPGYMHIDTTILCQHFLDERRPDMTKKKRYWAKVLDLPPGPFKPQGADKSMLFRGSLQTDGVGVSIIKQDQDTKAGGPQRSKKKEERARKIHK